MSTLGTRMGNLRDLKRPSGPWCCFLRARCHILWLRICTFAAISGARTATPIWQEQALSGVGILQRLGSEQASSRLDLAPSESCLLQYQKFRSRGCICALLELGLASLGPEVAFFRPKVSCDSANAGFLR
jgi:hypothetical protein